jgi:ATP adenylyltransferase
VSLEQLWAGWRGAYVAGASAAATDGCVLCRLTGQGDDGERYVVWRRPLCIAVLNAYPYTSGHLMIVPTRHVGDLENLSGDEAAALWGAVTLAVRAAKGAYHPDGMNIGVNLGRSAGAGVPGHLHVHVLPRWDGDTNFTTTVAALRVLPEALPDTWAKLRAAWPTG